MLVVIDVGNSEVKLGLLSDGRIVSTRRTATHAQTARFDAEGLLLDALGSQGSAIAVLDAIALVSVVPRWTDSVTDLAARLGVDLLVADPATIPMAVNVRRPERVGADRLLNAYAASRLHGAPAIVVDLGTATTVDAVDADGAFVGGAIAPGLELGLRALASGTAQLPRAPLAVPSAAIGRDTAEAIQSGTVFGHVGLVRELVDRMTREMVSDADQRPTVVVTGGLSRGAWVHLLPGVDVVDPDLTLRGLAVLHAEHTARVPPATTPTSR
jgi:type III pantothenate kinase